MNWYLAVLKKYAVFSGRARRKELWYFALVNFIIETILASLDHFVFGSEPGNGLLSSLYSLAVLIPSTAVGFRRLHDIGKSGWWILLGLIPVLGWIVLIVFAAQDSQPGSNQYGSNPKGA